MYKAYIINTHFHELFNEEHPALQVPVENWMPIPDGLPEVPEEWLPYIDSTFTWTKKDGWSTEEINTIILDKVKKVNILLFEGNFKEIDNRCARPTQDITARNEEILQLILDADEMPDGPEKTELLAYIKALEIDRQNSDITDTQVLINLRKLAAENRSLLTELNISTDWKEAIKIVPLPVK